MIRFRKMITMLLVLMLTVQMAPEAVCNAVESTYRLVVNPETPLDEVYFYSNKTENKDGGYYYGYQDGKIAIMDEEYNLVKKTDFNEYTSNTGSISMVKGTQAFVAAKVLGEDERIYGILSSAGETIIPAEYAFLGKSMDRTLITVGKEQESGEILYGVWDSDCNEILPCEYPYAYACGSDEGKALIQVRKDKNGPGILMVDGEEIFTEDEIKSEYDYYSYSFEEYKGSKYIMIHHFYMEGEYNFKSDIGLYSYSGIRMFTLSEKEYEDYYLKYDYEEPENIEYFDSESHLGLKVTGSKFTIYNQKTGRDIYISEQGESEPYYSENYGQYYFVNIYNDEDFTVKTMIIDTSSDEVKFYGNKYETYIRINEDNREIIVFGKKGAENILPSPIPDQNPEKTDEPAVTPTPTPIHTISPVPTPTVKPDVSPGIQNPADSSKPANTTKETQLELSKDELLVAVNESVAVKVNTNQAEITARSGNDKIAAVSVTGKDIKISIPKKAVKGTSTYIYVSAGDKTAKIKVTVKNATKKIKPVKKTVTIKKGKQYSLKFKITAQEKKKTVTDTAKVISKNKKIVKVGKYLVKKGSASVKVKGVKKGKTSVMFKLGSKQAKVTVKVR